MKFTVKRTLAKVVFLTLVFLTTITPLLHAQNSNHKITMKVQNISILDFFQQIEMSTSFTIVYKDIFIDQKKDITVDVENKPLIDVLKKVLSPRGLQAVFKNNTIVITKKNDEPKPTTSTRIVSGVVLDEKGQPVIGASVVVPGTTIGVATDMNGRFTLEAPANARLRFSYIGYDARVEAADAVADLKVVLEPTPQLLSELVITAQAIGQKNAIRQQINSNTIKNVVASDRLQENPDANSVEAIGRLPGISVQRSGGEGVGLVIRGLEPRYSSVTLNGVQLPSTSGTDRGTNLSGISQYALQGVEVFKSLTADMDANSVAGTVNLKLRKADRGFHMNVMAQRGYNDLNKYFGNYKYLGEFSNRFLDNRLGVLFTANAEKVNRSIQTMSAGYGIDSNDPEGDILLNTINLNDIKNIIYRRSAMLSLDYSPWENTTLILYGMYNSALNNNQHQAKNYSMAGAGSVGYTFSFNPAVQTDVFQTALSGETIFDFLSLKADYGFSYSTGNNVNLGSRSWNFNFNNASSAEFTDIEHRKLHPADVVPLFTDNPDRLADCYLFSLNTLESRIFDRNINAYANFTVPFKIGTQIAGNFKFGGAYRTKNRKRDDLVGSQIAEATYNVALPKILTDSLSWIVRSANGNVTANGLTDGKVNNFLNGQFNFGNTFNIERLNQLSDTWEKSSDFYYKQGKDVYLPIFGDISKLGYTQNVAGSMFNDQQINEKYMAAYVMSEINIGKHLMFLPGVRFEDTRATMKGFYAIPLQYAPPIDDPLPGSDTSAVRSDRFLLPMIHLRVKPSKNFYMHFAYTQTLSRPDFNAIAPNYFVNTGMAPFVYNSNNPTIKPERWTNLDAQFVVHSGKAGLLSANIFYKTVNDKIWNRSYQRIKDDPIIPPFPNTAVVNVYTWENHSYKGQVSGVEIDWQTSFNYLPNPFKYFTISTNYTFSNSKTNYPYSRIDMVRPPGGGRPVAVRTDSTTTGPMLMQPKHIANASLGFNKGGFNAWLSFQYNGLVYTGKNYRAVPRLDAYKDYFYRWDLQLKQRFKIKDIDGFEVILNIANISNYTESQRLAGDPRPTYQENYGWTTDLGFRFRL